MAPGIRSQNSCRGGGPCSPYRAGWGMTAQAEEGMPSDCGGQLDPERHGEANLSAGSYGERSLLLAWS